MTHSELLEFLDAPSAPYYYGFKASDIGQCLYKICDNNVRLRQFLSADNENEIEAILADHEGHSLHEIIDSNEPLCPIIDFNLLREVYNSIKTKLKVCLEIFPKWNPEIITIASSSDAKKMSYHISTFGIRLPNIAKVAVFTELMLGSPKYDEETKEHICVKKAIYPKNGSIFDFMLLHPNNDSEIKDSSLLAVLKPEVKRFPVKNNDIISETTEAEFEVVETLLKEAGIEGYNLSYPSDKFPNKFLLSRISPSDCPLCDREHTNKQSGMRNPPLKLAINETALDREKKLQSLHEARQNGLYFDMGVELKLANFKIKIIKYGGESVKIFAKPAPEINKEIIDLILWHTLNIISDGNVKLHEYLWDWWAYLMQKPEEKLRTILVLKSTLKQYLEKILGHFNSAIQARKLSVMNETEMSSENWYMVTSNQDALIKIDIGDSHIVCYDVLSHCRGNTAYFKRLHNVFNHPDAPGVVMKYLLNHDILDFEPQEIPLPVNETTDIPIFNIPETISQKITSLQPVKNEAEPSVASTSKTPEPVIDESEISKLFKSIEPINKVVNLPPKEIPTNSPKPSSNELSSAILLARIQLNSIAFWDRMETDSRMCSWVEEMKENPNEYMDMSVRKRLIGEEIIRYSLEEDEIISSWLDTDEKWKKMLLPTMSSYFTTYIHIAMSATVTKYVVKHKLNKDMSNEELSQHVPALLELLTDKLKRDKGCRCFQKGYDFRGDEAGKVNIYQISNIIPDEKTIESIAQRIVRDNLGEKEIKMITNALTITSPNPIATTSRLSRLRRELRKLNVPEKIISATLDEETICASNKIQKECKDQCENEGIDFSDHFSLESVKERLNFYDVSNTSDMQALADIMIMLCIRPTKIKNLRISNEERDEERAKLLLTWIQDAISSGQLRDLGVPGHSSDSITSEQEVIRRTEKTTQLFGLDEQNTRAYKALSRQILGFENQLENYHFKYTKLKRRVNSLEAEIENLDECVDREAVVDLIHEIVLSLIGKKDKDFSYSSESSENSNSVEIIERSHEHRVREEKALPHAFAPLTKQ
ncbi:hypothetical protein C1645_835199 [Glomus cerebriforme]|uniref:Uncharacterized protein n=1 Tax=Glomus cerebriforme TaxID=658196 RepID=A0A397SCX4_9GLOM|nr:hypothetical protein C1645_835199 [Glomus cerebriforme]